MELNNTKINILNNYRKTLPVPIQQSPTPNVEKPNYYGKSPYPMAYQVSSRKNDQSQYENILDPSPRNQLVNIPNNSCKKSNLQPFRKDSCYLMDNKNQGVIGLMCDESGGSNNSNFVRGNEFGLMNRWDMLNEIKKDEYTVEIPVQRPMFLNDNTIVNNRTQFYPTTNYYLSKSKNYKTYPKSSTLTEKGYPKYVYPYKTLNNIENFMDFESNKNMMNLIIILLTIIVLIIIIYMIKRE